MAHNSKLSPELKKAIEVIRSKSVEAGLDFFTTSFELVDYKKLHEIAAYGGFPVRYPHWRWGMEFEKLIKNYEYGLATIYEMVINNDPCYAYLLDSNDLATQKTVIAHVYAHSDFFKNNIWFSRTNRKMLDQMANNAQVVRSIIEDEGQERVEDFIDHCLSLENLLDASQLFSAPKREETKKGVKESEKRKPTKNYMSSYVKPEAALKEETREELEKKERAKEKKSLEETDVLKFFMNNLSLPAWQMKILDIVRKEAYYYLPQRQTKILNEGWATYWHSKMMTKISPLDSSEIIDYCNQYAGIVAQNGPQVNPYRLGLELLKYVEHRWDTGRFGLDYFEREDKSSFQARESNQGLEKIFEVRKIHNDLSFIDSFFDEEFCHRTKMFIYEYDPNTKKNKITSRDFKQIKMSLLKSLTNSGCPLIKIVDDNYNGRKELLLRHYFDGQELKQDVTLATLKRLHFFWKRPIHIETVIGEVPKTLSFDGNETSVNKVQ